MIRKFVLSYVPVPRHLRVRVRGRLYERFAAASISATSWHTTSLDLAANRFECRCENMIELNHIDKNKLSGKSARSLSLYYPTHNSLE